MNPSLEQAFTAANMEPVRELMKSGALQRGGTIVAPPVEARPRTVHCGVCWRLPDTFTGISLCFSLSSFFLLGMSLVNHTEFQLGPVEPDSFCFVL